MWYPKISIVTPTLNSQKYLEECIRSVTEQQYPNLEYVVVDGGSTDNTLQILEKLKSCGFKVIEAPGSGAAEAINKGFAATTGEIMYWLNSDDKLHSGALFAVAKVFNELSDIEWIMGLPTWIGTNGTAYSEMSYGYSKFYQSPKYINDSMHLRFARWSKWRFAMGDFSAIQQESVFWRRSLWQRSGGHLKEGIIAYDLELWTRFFQHAELFTLKILLAGFRVHPAQVSAKQQARYSAESEKIISAYIQAIGGQSLKNTIRKKLARTARVLFYYQIPYLEAIFRRLMNLPDFIDYCLETERFILRSK